MKLDKRNKYNARKIEVNGIVFDSRKEAGKYIELKLLQRAGEVVDIQLQPEFVLVSDFEHRGKKVRGIKYTADFLVRWRDGRVQVIDVKGYRTRDYIIRKKLFLLKYPEYEFVEE